MKQHINLSSHSKALTDLIQSIDQIGTQRSSALSIRDSIHASHSTLPIILPSLSQESLLSSARDVSHQTTKTLIRRRDNKSRFSLYTRKSEATPQGTCNFGQWDTFVDSINNDDSGGAMESLVHIMVLIVEQDNLRLLIRVFRLASLTLMYFKEYGKALVFLKNCIFLSQFPRDFETIQWCLLQLGLVCKMVQKYEIGKVFMKKAVEFAWFTEDLDKELHCYEELGKLCFMNYELQLAKQLHDMSMAGRKRNDEIMRISRQGLEQLVRNYPSQQLSIDQQILSKIIDFPFIIRAAQELRPIQNKYLSKHFLECVPAKRLYSSIEEILNKIMQDHHFFFEIPMPIENPHTVDKPLSRKDRIKSTQMITWIKLAIQKEKTFKTPMQVVQPSVENRKLSLDQAVTERLGQRIPETKEIFKNIQCVKQKNVECIRLTSERNKANSKEELLKLARELY